MMDNKKPKMNMDAWGNSVTGAGTAKDKSMHNTFNRTLQPSFTMLEALYESDWIVGKMCDIVPYEMTKKWITIKGDLKPNKIKEIEAYLSKYEIQAKFKEVLTWSRLYGGGAIMMVVNDGKEVDEELDPTKVKELLNLIVLDAKTLQPKTWDNDIESDNYGEPEIYQFSTLDGMHKTVHTSRLLKFKGVRVSQRASRRYRGWGASTVTRVLQTIQDTQMLDRGVATLVAEAKYDTIYVPNLTEYLLSDNSDELTNLYSNINVQKSITNSILLDAEMRQERTSYQFGGISDIQKNQLTTLSTALEIPEMVLVGRSNGGLNSSQKETLEIWYDKIASYQADEMTKPIQMLLDIFNAINGGKKHIEFEFTPLSQLSEMDKATIKSSNANADSVYLNAGVVTADEVRDELRQDKVYDNLEDTKADGVDDTTADNLIKAMKPKETKPKEETKKKPIVKKDKYGKQLPDSGLGDLMPTAQDVAEVIYLSEGDTTIAGATKTLIRFKTLQKFKEWLKRKTKYNTYGKVTKEN